MLNSVLILGRLTKDPENKVTTEGTVVSKFTIAANRGYGDKQVTEFVNCIAFGKTAENIKKYVKKGHLLMIAGYLKTSKWEYESKTYYRTEIVVEKSTFLPNEKNAKDTESKPKKAISKSKAKKK
jgi:single-strand DNA-binding protein